MTDLREGVRKAGGAATMRRVLAGLTGVICALLASNAAVSKPIAEADTLLHHPAAMVRAVTSSLFTSVTRAGPRLVAVGERGRIAISNDNGRNWSQIPTPTSVTLTAVRFADAANGWVTGQMGVVLHSGDGGLHWTMQLDGFAANAATLEAAKKAPKPANQTDDTDLVGQAQQISSGGANVPFLDILPLSAQDLVLVGGYGLAFTSGDGGQHWQSIFDKIPNPNGLHLFAAIRDEDGELLVGEQGLVLQRSKDGGVVTLKVPFDGTFFGAMMTPQGTLLAWGLQGTLLRSVDQGKTWTASDTKVTDGIDCGSVLDNGTMLLGDTAGNLLLSRDDGKSFVVKPLNMPVLSLTQAADKSVIAAGPFGMRRLSSETLEPGI